MHDGLGHRLHASRSDVHARRRSELGRSECTWIGAGEAGRHTVEHTWELWAGLRFRSPPAARPLRLHATDQRETNQRCG